MGASGGYPVAADRFNGATFTQVSTTRLRLVLTGVSASVGVLELRAFV